jgi:2',3'-cyclic-nucleotide 2'-phosphodiesterase
MKVLFIGDVVGRPGRRILQERLMKLRKELGLDLVIANGENAAGGAGLTAAIASELLDAGCDVLTLGDHTYDQRGFEKDIEGQEQVCRPANLPAGCPGRDRLIFPVGGKTVAVFTVLGRVFMPPRDCPFRAADRVLAQLKGHADVVIAEIHAEATSEKIGFGRYLDGRVAAVVGTHTHVPTGDAEIFAGGTAYMTDLGMTGPYRSVLGREIEPVVAGFLDGMPRRYEVASQDVRISGALIEIDADTGRATAIQQLTVRADHGSS